MHCGSPHVSKQTTTPLDDNLNQLNRPKTHQIHNLVHLNLGKIPVGMKSVNMTTLTVWTGWCPKGAVGELENRETDSLAKSGNT